MNNLGAFIKVNSKGQIIGVDVIAKTDKETRTVQEALKNFARPTSWSWLKRLLLGG